MSDDLKERLRANHLDECYEAIDRIEALTAERDALKAGRVRVKPLVWDVDGRSLHMDHTMAFSKSYNWDGWDCFRQEGYGIGASYIIWPDSICIEKWNLYGTADGLFVNDLRGEGAAKAAAQADYEARILSALELTPDTSQIDAIRAALEVAAREAETEGWSSPDALRIGFTEREEGSRDCAERIAQAIRALDPTVIAAKLKGDGDDH